MSKPIRSYQDMLDEKQQLEVLLQAQKELIEYDLKELKQQLQPAVEAISFLGKIVTKDRTNLLLTGGANQLIDLVVKKIILSRSNWLTRLTVPFFLKNYSSHFIAEHKKQWMQKLFSWISHKNSNGKAARDHTENEKSGEDLK